MGMPSGMELIVIALIIGLMILPIILHIKQKRIILEHKKSGDIKKVPFLFSWSSLVFGLFVPLFREDERWFIIYLITTIFTGGVGNIILPFFINKQYMEKLISEGYEPIDHSSKELLLSENINILKKSNNLLKYKKQLKILRLIIGIPFVLISMIVIIMAISNPNAYGINFLAMSGIALIGVVCFHILYPKYWEEREIKLKGQKC